ncbi:MAG: 2-oxoacid:acceptor oxidoreductase family protein, partial [Planctomycetota bacterium]
MGSSLPFHKKDDISIVLCGQAGRGIQTVEYLLTRILKLAGHNVFATKEYMSRIRGGTNSTEIRISSAPVRALISRIDILIPLDQGALKHVEKRVSPQTIILAEKSTIGADFDKTRHNLIDVPFTRIAEEIGDKIYANIVAVGVITGLLGVEFRTVSGYVERFFAAKGQDVIRKNLTSAKTGYELGRDLVDSSRIKAEIGRDAGVREQVLLSGTEAVALGAIAGGCNFISAYPMSPSTAVLVFFAQHAKEFG